MILTSMMLALAAPNPASLKAPRQAFAACLRKFEAERREAKLAPDAYAEAVKSACPAEVAAFEKALVDYDTAMGSKRAAALQNARLDVDDQVTTSIERYRDVMSGGQ